MSGEEADAAVVDEEIVDPAAADEDPTDTPGDPEVVSDAAAGGDAPDGVAASMSDEAIVALIAERDEYLEALQRLKAEFANARRRDQERAMDQRSQAAAELVEKLLPVLDSCDAAVGQGVEQVVPVRDALFDALAGQGLARMDPAGEPFDPELHDAVMYEEGDGSGNQTVIETLRTGYRWNERVLRAPMVKVQG